VSVVLLTQLAQRMRRITSSSVVSLVLSYLPTLFHKGHDIRKKGEKKLLNVNLCFDFLYKFCHKYCYSNKKVGETVLQMYLGPQVKCSLFLSDFNKTLIFTTYFLKILLYQFS